MPKYKANRDTWLSHECRMVKAGETFTTDFPKAKGPDGKPVGDMKLSDNIELVKEDDEGDAKAKKPKGKPEEPLV